MNTFKKDLQLGNKYELKALEYIEYDNYVISQGNFKPFDIDVIKDDKHIYYEVKCDRLSYKTGNIAIEYECSNKPSGISTTKSDYYIYFVIYPTKEICFKIPTKELKELIKDCRSVRGGDGYRSKMNLLKIYKIHPFTILKKK